ncbi:MAG: hypothetical protein VZQ80_06495 [Lachnospiraceae bacterium]|nr:hypothetical protein [Lachnospiraceae bacterium]
MSEGPEKRQINSDEYRRLKKKRQRQRKVAKMKLEIATGVIAAAIVCIILGVLYAKDAFYKKADVTTLTVKDDGSLVLEEVVPVDGLAADESDIKASVKKSIEDFESSDIAATEDSAGAAEAGSKVGTKIGKVKLAAVHIKDDTAYVRTTYTNAVTYAGYSGYNCYIGSVAGAKAAGFDFTEPLCPVTGKEKGEAVAADTLSDLDGQEVVIVNESLHIRVPGEISYVSDTVTAIADSNETGGGLESAYGTTVAPDSYVLYKVD